MKKLTEEETNAKIEALRSKIRNYNRLIRQSEETITKLQQGKWEKPDYTLEMLYRDDDKEILIPNEEVVGRDTETHKLLRNPLPKNIALKTTMQFDANVCRFEYETFYNGLKLLKIGTIFHLKCHLNNDENMPERTPRYIKFIKIVGQNPLTLEEKELWV